ncbi:MAG: phytoene desaturase [Azospira oryzae]|jgi:phytoene desaturase|nr:MAG: phytoene desaturase [Azospira oryzae]
MQKAAVIGAGFSGLSAATHLAHLGFDVTVYEKHDQPGGRARKFEAQGFTFDMGPSWYWMPDVFDRYFNHFGKTTSNYYDLKRLDPSYRIYFGKDDFMDVPAGIDALSQLFDQLEPGSSRSLQKFIEEGKYKYEIGMHDLVYKPGLSITELMDYKLMAGVFRLHVFHSMSSYVRRFFKHPRIIKLLEFPVLFLGATAENTPALYSLMNYADMALGTWYPMGGMFKIAEGMEALAKEKGVQFKYNSPIEEMTMNGDKVKCLRSDKDLYPLDYVVASADYHYVEQQLLPKKYRRYSEAYWSRRVMAPSSLIFYIGLNKRVKKLLHHTLFFDEDFALHANEIYEDPKWPTSPQFYVSCPSQTDDTVAPAGHENLFILIPVAPALHDSESIREKYFDLVINRMESISGESIRQHIVYKKSYAHNDFIADYHSFKGNAYGLANTLWQTANLKPSMVNKKVSNLFYTGQLTVPGPGVPPSIISGQVVAGQVKKVSTKK